VRVPTYDQQRCPKCKGRVVNAKTGRMSRGAPVIVALVPEEDTVNDKPNDSYLLTVTGDTYTAGLPTSRLQREALRRAGHVFHLPHKCPPLR